MPTAYCGGYLLSSLHPQFAEAAFGESHNVSRYLSLLEDYARLIDQFTERTAGQAERGIRIPKVQVLQARSLLSRLKSAVRANLAATPHHACAWSRDFTRR